MNPKNRYFLATLTFVSILTGCASAPTEPSDDPEAHPAIASLGVNSKPVVSKTDSSDSDNDVTGDSLPKPPVEAKKSAEAATSSVAVSESPKEGEKDVELTAAEAIAAANAAALANTPMDPASAATLRKILANLNVQVQTVDNKLNLLIQRMEDEKKNKGKGSSNNNLPLTQVVPPPSDLGGSAVTFVPAMQDPEGSFIHDAAVQDFRKAMILFQGEKYSDAVLAFSDFVGDHPDHTLAGTAQFYVAEAYFYQREYKLAVQEFQTLLTYYKKNAHISDSLRDMALAEDQLRNPEAAARHRQLLTAIFPQSPAAAPPEPGTSVNSLGTQLGSAPPATLETPQTVSSASNIYDESDAPSGPTGPVKVLQLKPTRLDQVPTLKTPLSAAEPPVATPAEILKSKPSEVAKTQPAPSSLLDSPPETATLSHDDFRNIDSPTVTLH